MKKTSNKKKPRQIVSFDDEIIKKGDADNLLNSLKNNDNKIGTLKRTLDLAEGSSVGTESKKKKKKQNKPSVNEKSLSESQLLGMSIEKQSQNKIVKDNLLDKTKKHKKKKVNITKRNQNESFESNDKINAEQLCENEEHPLPDEPKKHKRKKIKQSQNKNLESDKNMVEEEHLNESQDENPSEATKIKTTESKRSLKRKKHAKLIEENKLKYELKMQQAVLNYLSKWKHARSEWKFEKLKQIWLQQNLFVVDKIPEEFWDTVVEYFNGSKGAIRKVILSEAVKIIDTENQIVDENEDEESQIRLRRARNVAQCLEE